MKSKIVQIIDWFKKYGHFRVLIILLTSYTLPSSQSQSSRAGAEQSWGAISTRAWDQATAGNWQKKRVYVTINQVVNGGLRPAMTGRVLTEQILDGVLPTKRPGPDWCLWIGPNLLLLVACGKIGPNLLLLDYGRRLNATCGGGDVWDVAVWKRALIEV